MEAQGRIRVKRAYEAADPVDGRRVLVDRLWPRGLAREALALDAWAKDLAPSPALRRWFGHDPEKWAAFKDRYFAELDAKPEAAARLLDMAREGPLTLLYAARETRYNNAVALKEYLERRLSAAGREEAPASSAQERGDGDARPGYASPPCFMHELDPSYLGYLDREETLALLGALLEAGRKAERAAAALARSHRSAEVGRLFASVFEDERRFRRKLAAEIRRLGAEPAPRADPAGVSSAASSDIAGHRDILVKALEFTAETLRGALARIADDRLRDLLAAMLAAQKRTRARLEGDDAA